MRSQAPKALKGRSTVQTCSHPMKRLTRSQPAMLRVLFPICFNLRRKTHWWKFTRKRTLQRWEIGLHVDTTLVNCLGNLAKPILSNAQQLQLMLAASLLPSRMAAMQVLKILELKRLLPFGVAGVARPHPMKKSTVSCLPWPRCRNGTSERQKHGQLARMGGKSPSLDTAIISRRSEHRIAQFQSSRH